MDNYCVMCNKKPYYISYYNFTGRKDLMMKTMISLGGQHSKIYNLTLRHILGIIAHSIDDCVDSRSNPFQEGEDDVILTMSLVSQGSKGKLASQALHVRPK